MREKESRDEDSKYRFQDDVSNCVACFQVGPMRTSILEANDDLGSIFFFLCFGECVLEGA